MADEEVKTKDVDDDHAWMRDETSVGRNEAEEIAWCAPGVSKVVDPTMVESQQFNSDPSGEPTMSAVSPTERARTGSMNDILANNWWAAALRAVIAILFGLAALAMPVVTMLSLALAFGAFSFVDGILMIIMAIRGARRGNSWVWLLLNGIFGILAGIVAFVWPGLTVLAFVLLVAAWSLVAGVAMLISAFRLKVAHGRAWLVVGGIASVALGILLVLSPLAGALVLTFWIGALSIVLGISLLVLAYRLRSQRTHVPHDFATATPA